MARGARVRTNINVQLGRTYTLQKAIAGVNGATEDALNQYIEILSIPPERTGEHYAGNTNRSSDPGEAPAPQTQGGLRQTATRTPAEVTGSTVSARVGSPKEYAAALELGTDNIEPRPALGRLRTEAPRRERLVRVFQIVAARVGNTIPGAGGRGRSR